MDPIAQNVAGVQQLVGSKLNKISDGVTNQFEGVEGEFVDELSLDLSDEELLNLSKKWELRYAGYEAKLKERQNANKTFYLGTQREGGPQAVEGKSISGNFIFEAEETFLPAALSKNPEPVVWTDNSTEGTKLASDVKSMLQYHADTLVLRRKLTLVTRHWSIYFIGIIKHGWDETIKDIKSDVRDPRNFVLDPDGFVNSYADYEGPLGERITIPASDLIDLFPKHKELITIMVDGKLGTDVTYTEWWTDTYCFYTFKGHILDKNKNPHFNYDKKIDTIDLDGAPTTQTVPGKNQFAKPKKPYTMLSVFSLAEQPHDITNPIEQNIPNQRRISRRIEQIDYNLSRSNNSDVFSEANFNQETAKQAATAFTKGNPVLVPQGGPLAEAVHRLQAPGIGGEFFTELETSKRDLRSIFGTEGITPQANNEETTARGMILNQQFDSSRIGGGIGDALEQVADNIFNWWLQLYYVYYDETHTASILGKLKAVEYVELSAQSFDRKIVVSVAPDSMKPRDEITEMNQALTLFQEGALDIKTLLTLLNFPDAQNTAAQVMLYRTNPQLYMQLNFPDLVQQLQQTQQPPVGPTGSPQGAPQVQGQAPPTLAEPPANPSLNQVPINTQATPQ